MTSPDYDQITAAIRSALTQPGATSLPTIYYHPERDRRSISGGFTTWELMHQNVLALFLPNASFDCRECFESFAGDLWVRPESSQGGDMDKIVKYAWSAMHEAAQDMLLNDKGPRHGR